MNVASIFVVFSVCWFLMFLLIIPIRLKTQGDVGQVVKGTSAGAPEVHHLRIKAQIATGLAIALTAVAYVIISQGLITLEMIDFFNRLDGAGGEING